MNLEIARGCWRCGDPIATLVPDPLVPEESVADGPETGVCRGCAGERKEVKLRYFTHGRHLVPVRPEGDSL